MTTAQNTTHDIVIENHGSVIVVQPMNMAARDWIDANVSEPTWWGTGLVCEPRYVAALVEGMQAEGFIVQV